MEKLQEHSHDHYHCPNCREALKPIESGYVGHLIKVFHCPICDKVAIGAYLKEGVKFLDIDLNELK